MCGLLNSHGFRKHLSCGLLLSLIFLISFSLSACASVSSSTGEEGFKPVGRVVVAAEFVENSIEHITTVVGVTPLIYMIVPNDATNQNVIWNIHEGSGTGAEIFDTPLDAFDVIDAIPENAAVCYLYAYESGEVTVDATVTNGIRDVNDGQEGEDYIRRFKITVQPMLQVTDIMLLLDYKPDQSRGNISGTILAGRVEPADATNQSIEWSIINRGKTKAEINEDNVISSETAGSVTIRARIKDGVAVGQDYIKNFTFPMEVWTTSIKLKESTVLKIGDSETIPPTISPNNATNQRLIWTSTTPKVATVSNNGLVNAVAAGNAIITASTADGNYVSACLVTVEPLPVGAESRIEITLNKNSMSLSLTGSKYNYLQASVSSSYSSNQDLIWTSSDDGIATVTSGRHERLDMVPVHVLKGERATVTAVSPGTAIITVTTADGRYFTTCNVTVQE